MRFASVSSACAYQLTASPENADLVLFVGSSEPSYKDVLRNPVFRAHPSKCALFESSDRCIPLIPGIYAGLKKNWAPLSCGAALSGFYIRVAENTSMDIDEPVDSGKYLFSFVGSANNHIVRHRILQIRDRRAFLRDSSQDSVQQADGIVSRNSSRGKLFRNVMATSKFVLCPRGIGVSSWRLFETMRAGRVPVIISDQWLPPLGPDWSAFSVRVRERDVVKIPEILRETESLAPDMGRKARDEWMRFYDERVIFNTVVDLALRALHNFKNRNRLSYPLRRLQYLEPFFMRHWVLSPMARRLLGRM